MTHNQDITLLTKYIASLQLAKKLLDDDRSPTVCNEAAMISALRRYCLQKNVDENAN